MKATKRIEMEIAADVQTKKCNGIGGEPQGLCGQKISYFLYILKVTYQNEGYKTYRNGNSCWCTKKCNGIGEEPQGLCGQKNEKHFIHIEGYVSKWRPQNV